MLRGQFLSFPQAVSVMSNVSMPWHQPPAQLQAEYAAASGALAQNPQDWRAQLAHAHATVQLELAERQIWVGDVVRLGRPGRRGVLQLRDEEPYLVVQTGPAPEDDFVVTDLSTIEVEPAWGPPESLSGQSAEQIAASLAASESIARISARMIRNGHAVETFHGDSRLVVLELVARYLARPEFAWRNGLVDQHLMRALCIQLTRAGSQFDLPGSKQEWFALELVEAYLQEFRPQATDRTEPWQSGQTGRSNDDLQASA